MLRKEKVIPLPMIFPFIVLTETQIEILRKKKLGHNQPMPCETEDFTLTSQVLPLHISTPISSIHLQIPCGANVLVSSSQPFPSHPSTPSVIKIPLGPDDEDVVMKTDDEDSDVMIPSPTVAGP